MAFVLSRSGKSKYRPILILEPSRETVREALRLYNIEQGLEDRGIATTSLNSGRRLPGVPHPIALIANRPESKPLKEVPDILSAGDFTAISERMKVAIDKIEPGIHQFEAVTFFDSKGKSRGLPYFIWILGRNIDGAIDFDRTTAVYEEYHGKRFVSLPETNAAEAVVLKKTAIGHAQAWRSPELHLDIVISDSLHEILSRMSLVGVDFTKIGEF